MVNSALKEHLLSGVTDTVGGDDGEMSAGENSIRPCVRAGDQAPVNQVRVPRASSAPSMPISQMGNAAGAYATRKDE